MYKIENKMIIRILNMIALVLRIEFWWCYLIAGDCLMNKSGRGEGKVSFREAGPG